VSVNHFTHPSLDLNNPENLSLTIEIGFSDYSACVFSNVHQEVIYAETLSYTSLADLKEKSSVLSKAFNDVTVILFTPQFTLIPNAIKDEQNNAEFIKLSCGEKSPHDVLLTEDIKQHQCLLLYYAPSTWLTFFTELFKQATFTHAAARLLATFNLTPNHQLNVHVYNQHVLLSYFKNNQLTFINTLDYQHHNDFIYALLFASKELGLVPLETNVHLSGFYNVSLENAMQKFFKKIIGFTYENKSSGIIPLSYTPYFALSLNTQV